MRKHSVTELSSQQMKHTRLALSGCQIVWFNTFRRNWLGIYIEHSIITNPRTRAQSYICSAVRTHYGVPSVLHYMSLLWYKCRRRTSKYCITLLVLYMTDTSIQNRNCFHSAQAHQQVLHNCEMFEWNNCMHMEVCNDSLGTLEMPAWKDHESEGGFRPVGSTTAIHNHTTVTSDDAMTQIVSALGYCSYINVCTQETKEPVPCILVSCAIPYPLRYGYYAIV